MASDKIWKLRRLGYHCRCETCLSKCGPVQKKLGKFWQARYGESTQEFRKRYQNEHRKKRDAGTGEATGAQAEI
jgi:hypothetical protein